MSEDTKKKTHPPQLSFRLNEGEEDLKNKFMGLVKGRGLNSKTLFVDFMRRYVDSSGAIPPKDLSDLTDFGSNRIVTSDTIGASNEADPRLSQVLAVFQGALAEAKTIAGVQSDGATVPPVSRTDEKLEALEKMLRELHTRLGDAPRRRRDPPAGKGNRERSAS